MTPPNPAVYLTPELYGACLLQSSLEHDQGPHGPLGIRFDVHFAAPALAALGRYMVDLAAKGLIAPIQGARGRRGLLIDAWDSLVHGKADEYDVIVCARFAFLKAMLDDAHDVDQAVRAGVPFDRACSDGYASILASAGTGDVQGMEMSGRCETTGDHLGFEMRNWRPVAMIFDGSGFTPAHDVERPGIQHVEVEFPSGDVLVTDVLDLEAFLGAVAWSERDVGSMPGRMSASRDLAGMGVASVWIGRDASPMVAVVDGALVIGTVDGEYQGPAPDNFGRVTTATWNVMMADRQTLIGLLSRTMSEDAARSLVDGYVAGAGSRIMSVSVAPGIHHLYLAGDADEFADDFSRDMFDLEVPEGFKPMFVVSPRSLAAEPDTPRP